MIDTYEPKITKGFDKGKAATGRKAWYVSVDRKKSYYADEAERDREYQKTVALSAFGVGHVQTTARHESELREMIRLAQARGAESLLEVFRAGLSGMPQQAVLLDQAAREFKAAKRAQLLARNLKPRSYKQQRLAVDCLLKKFSGRTTADLRNPAFKDWFMSLPHGPWGRYSFAHAIAVFLNWMVGKKMLTTSPLTELDIPKPAPKRVALSAEQATAILAVGVVEYPDLTTLLAAEWMAGVRPETAELLHYEDFIWEEKAIRLRSGKFDEGDVKFVERFPDVFWKWIPKGKVGPVVPLNYKKKLTEFHHRLGFTKDAPWPQDVARRTCISHIISLTGSVERGAFVANHTRPSTTLNHYRRRFPEANSKAYFQQTPATLRKWYRDHEQELSRVLASIVTALRREPRLDQPVQDDEPCQ